MYRPAKTPHRRYPLLVGCCVVVQRCAILIPVSKSLAPTKGHTMTANTATAVRTAAAFLIGDVVWGRPVREGQAQARRKGIVLGYLADDVNQVTVWWFGQGAATADNTTLMFAHELTKAGDIFDMDSRRALKLAKLADTGYGRARPLRNLLARHADRMRRAGL